MNCNYELSPRQKSLYFIQLLDGKAQLTYNEPLIYRIEGEISLSSLQKSFDSLLMAHPMLRACFKQDANGVIYQSLEDNSKVEIEVTNCRKDIVARKIEDFISRPFDMAQAPLLRVGILHTEPEKYRLVIVFHHIIIDGISLKIILNDLARFYNHFELGSGIMAHENSTSQYIDCIYKHQKNRTTNPYKEKTIVLATKLQDYHKINFIPNPTYPLVQDYFLGDRVYFSINSDLYGKIKTLAKAYNTSIFNVFLAAYNIFISKYTNTQDIVVGVPFANRGDDPENHIVGYYANMMPVRSVFEEQQKFSEFLFSVRQNLLSLLTKQEVEFEDVALHLNIPHKAAGQHPIIQTSLNWAPYSEIMTPPFTRLKVQLEHKYFSKTAKFELSLFLLEEKDSEITCYFEYQTSLFDKSIIEQFSEEFTILLNHITQTPEQPIADLRLLDEAKEKQIASNFFSYPRFEKGLDSDLNKSLGELFEYNARLYGSNYALFFEDRTYTYQEILKKTEFWACYIRDKYENMFGVSMSMGTLIMLCLPRHPDMIFAILGVLRAGGTYVPVDPTFPRERIEYIATDSQAALVLTHKNFYPQGLNISPEKVIFMDYGIELDGYQGKVKSNLCSVPTNTPAYIIYTSGSTGNPKGVIITHENVLSLFRSIKKYCHFSQDDIWSLFHTYCFDVSVWEIWGAFLFGGELVVVPQEETRDPEKLYLLLKERKITILTLTPLAFNMIINQDILDQDKLALRYIFFAGESLKLSMLKPWVDKYGTKDPVLINMYGATEATIHTTYKKIELEDIQIGRDNIGKALDEFRICIMDNTMRWTPVGVIGEICIGGNGLAKGYLNRTELTKEKFIPDPYQSLLSLKSDERLYRTGDLGRWMQDGSIEYIGRKDFQVKLRGSRIELGEIESAISNFDGISQTLVLLKGTAEHAYLVAYYTVKPNQYLNTNALKKHLQFLLPEYMIPQKFVQLDSFPITINGKIDRKILTQREDGEELTFEIELLANQREKDIALIWSNVLKVDFTSIGRNSSFFTLGGNSLLVVKMLALVKNRLGYALSISQFMAEPTIASLAKDEKGWNKDISQPFVTRIKEKVILDQTIQPLEKKNTNLLLPNAVLLTGATGFLGIHVLDQLLSKTNVSKVYCLVRASCVEKAFDRIYQKIRKYDLGFSSSQMARIVPVIGDLTQDKMGISSEQFNAMASEIDSIFHVAAHVNHILDFEALYKENVQSTLEIIKFSVTKKNKVIHFVSTLAAGFLSSYIDQEMELGFLKSGYVTTKFASEYLLRQASDRGIAAYVYRPGNIVAGEKGVCEPENNTTLLRLKGLLQLKKAFFEPHENVEMIPVDALAEAIIKLSMYPQRFDYNLHNMEDLSWKDYIFLSKEYGFEIDWVQDKESWEDIISQISEENALYKVSWFYNLKQPQVAKVKPDYIITTKPYKEMVFNQLKTLQKMGFLQL